MIGTPNAASPAAETNDVCAPIFGLRPIANATRLRLTQGNDDGLVPVEIVESQEYLQSLGRTEHDHTKLLSEKEYQMSKDILLGKK